MPAVVAIRVKTPYPTELRLESNWMACGARILSSSLRTRLPNFADE
jgi:hypothetical protein